MSVKCLCSTIIFSSVIQAISCEKAVSKLRKKLMVPKMNEECKKIKCPLVEEPVCVKMTRHDLGRSMHIVAANKCELDYIKCHDDVEAKIVPMKYCGHNAAPRAGNKKKKMGKHIRVKRRVAKSMHAQKSDDQNKRFKLHKARLIRKRLARMQRNNVISNAINKYSVLNDINRLKMKHGVDKRSRSLKMKHSFSSAAGSDWENNERIKMKKGIAGHEFSLLSKEVEPPKDFSALFEGRLNISYKNGLNDAAQIQEQPLQLSQRLDDFDMLSEEFSNTSIELMKHTDSKNYETLCPNVCPSRDVMVCGRCQHGIYRTFLSVCHMKMLSCHQDDEVLELISRYPCVLSAPFLSVEAMKPKGRVREAGDVDEILRFLNCQERGSGFVKDLNGKLLLELISRYPCVLSAPFLSVEAMKPKGRVREAGDVDEILRFLNCQERGSGFVKDLNGKLSCAASFLRDPAEVYKAGDRYFYFPGDGDDTMHLVDSKQPIDFEFIKKYTKNPTNYGYWLYTRYNPHSAQIISFRDAGSVAESNFDFSKVTVFFAHGWKGGGKTEMNELLREAFLEDGDVNIIVFDWSELAKENYMTAQAGTGAVGRGLGQFIKWLISLGASYENIHLVGFGLGGHLVGNAGRETGSAVRRITALDPAYPLWAGDNGRVVATDGQYVEVIHTNTAVFGWTDPCGHADFYPNGGYKQPGCTFNSCSHSLAYWYMYRSVKKNHLLANECATLSEANNDNFNLECTGELYPMGNSDLSKSRSGIFRVNTRETYPN